MSAPLPEGVFHLLIADADRTHRAFLTSLALCGELLDPSSLPPSWFGDEVDDGREPRYCLGCVSAAVRWSAAEAAGRALDAGDGVRGASR